MTKIYQGNLPKIINVVVNGSIIDKAIFTNGVYETDNPEVVKELKDYGYEIEDFKPEDQKPKYEQPKKNAKNKKKKEI